MTIDRRTFLGGAGAGACGAWLSHTPPRPASPAADLGALAEQVRATSREDLLPKAVRWHRQGTHWRDLLGAAFLAGIRDVEPRPVGFAFHCVMMTHSAFQIAEALPEQDRLLPALYNLDDFKLSQGRRTHSGEWELGPAPRVASGDGPAAAAALAAALDAWDAPAAEAAATALARSASLDDAFAVLWPRGGRDFTNIGHKAIFVAQAYRTLQQIGWRHGEEVLRSLAWGLLEGTPGTQDQEWLPNVERGARLGLRRDTGKASVQASHELCAALRAADPDQAADAVCAAFRAGVGDAAVHDGLRLQAMELLTRLPGIVGVHGLTAVNALLYGARRCGDPVTATTLVLQAAGWLARYRAAFAARSGYRADRPGLDRLAAADGPTAPAAAFRTAAESGWEAAAPQALRAVADGGPQPFAAELRHWLVRKVREHHDYKYAAALLEESAQAQPAVGAGLLAAGLCYLRGPGDGDHPVVQAAAVR